MAKDRFFIDCHQDIAYSIRANQRSFDTDNTNYIINYNDTLKSKLKLIFSTIFVSHVKKEQRHQEALLQFKEYEEIFKKYTSFSKVKNNNDINDDNDNQ